MPTKNLTPMTARTKSQIKKLKKWWIVADRCTFAIRPGMVEITDRFGGEVFVDRCAFDRFIRWYVTGSPDGKIEVGDDQD